MICRRGRWRPLQDAMWLLVAVATVSMVITLHLGDSLTWFRSRSETRVRVSTDTLDQDRLEHLTFQRSISDIEAGHHHQALEDSAALLDVDSKVQNVVDDLVRYGNDEQIEDVSPSNANGPYKSSRISDVKSHGFSPEDKGHVNDDSRINFENPQSDDVKPHDLSPVDNGYNNNNNNDNKGSIQGPLQRDYNLKFKREKEEIKVVNGAKQAKLLFRNGLTNLTRANGIGFQLNPQEPSSLIIHGKARGDKDRSPISASGEGAEGGRGHMTRIGTFSYWIQKVKTKAKEEDGSVTDLNISALQALYDKLLQLEKSNLPSSEESSSVLVKGSLSSVKHHLPLIESAFHKYKASVTFEAPENASSLSADQLVQGDNWSIVMCLNATFQGDDCVVMAQHSSKNNRYRKVNIIPELNNIVMSPHLLCDTRNNQGKSRSGRWCGGDLPCHRDISQEITDNIQSSGQCNTTSGWWLVSDNNNKNGAVGQFIPCQDESTLIRSSIDSSPDAVIIPLPKNLLNLDGLSPLVWQVEILVTSLKPPRVYLHPDGLVWEGLQEYLHRKHQKNVSLLDLRQLITELDDESTATSSLAKLETAIMHLVRVIEHHMGVEESFQGLCPHCFHLLEAVMVFNSTFHPFIIEVTSSLNSDRLSSLSDYILEQNVLEDLAAMLVPRESTAFGVLGGLAALGVTQIQDSQVCGVTEKFCLKETDLTYLLDTKREQRASKNWIRVFPSTVHSCQWLHHHPFTNLDSTAFSEAKQPTSFFENFILAMESYTLCPGHTPDKDKSKCDFDIPVYNRASVPGVAINDVKTLNISSASCPMTICDNYTTSLPYLSAIYTNPYIQLVPEFSPLTTEYHVYVNFSTILVQIHARTKHCRTRARLEDKHEDKRWSNFSLGVGENTAHILVVDVDGLEPNVLNTYKIIIHRKGADDHLGIFDPNHAAHEICSLKQDCSFPLSAKESCGLQSVVSVSGWDDFLRHHMALPQCGPDSLSGQWVVPCSSCQNESTCYWKSAVWQPVDCREGKLSTDELKACLTDKKILFIGDSTNRGILHYILERLNGSLQQWDKTHNIRIYPDLNDGTTVFGFAYYPQFWLPSSERPMFDKALSELIKRTAGWADKKETVLVLGGVHWMAKHHIDMLVDGMGRESLSNAKVIVKGLGAGFHQPISGVHQLSLADQQRLSTQNAAMLSYANSHGFSTVDTFAMTMARYKDFLQGKCACHFHKVSTLKSAVVDKLSHNAAVPQDHHTRYHVEGDINAIYSEMVINRICNHRGG